MLRPLVNSFFKRNTRELRSISGQHFIRIKKKTGTKKVNVAVVGESVVDDKFIKLTVRDDATSKLKQLAILREENLKIIHTHDKLLETKIDDNVREEFKQIKMKTKIDMYNEPLMLLSLVKEALYKTKNARKDHSAHSHFDRNILNLFGKTPAEVKDYLGHINIERQLNEHFDVQVSATPNASRPLPSTTPGAAGSWGPSWA